MSKNNSDFLVPFIKKTRVLGMILGVALTFTGERYFSASPAHWWLSGFGFGLMIFALIGALFLSRKMASSEFPQEAKVWQQTVIWKTLILASFVIYLIYHKNLGTKATPEDLLGKVLLASWAISFTCGFFMGIGVEWAQLTNGEGAYAEPSRIRRASVSWLKVGLLAVILASTQYIAVKRNKTWDLSYLKTSKPSESTLQVVDSLKADVEVVLFFQASSEVLSQAKLYFNQLQGKPHLKISTEDVEINPIIAESYKLSKNGTIVVKSGEQSERIELGVKLTSARKNLKNIDSEFQKVLLSITSKKKTIYFTRGHGELPWTVGENASPLKSIKLLESFVRNLNYNLKFFSMTDGSTKEVPGDADAIVIVGGDQPFLPEESHAIESYLKKGGRVLALLDVDVPFEKTLNQGVRDASKDPLTKVFANLGVEFKAQVLANEDSHVAATRSPADTWFLFTNVFMSHDSMQALTKIDQKAAILTFRSGYLVTQRDRKDWTITETVKSLGDTFIDENRDFKLSPNEKKATRVIAVASEQKEATDGKTGRFVVTADSSMVSDALIRNQANLVYFVEALRWLVGESQVSSGLANTEEDVKIRHTNKEDIAWFYGTVVLVPGLVLGVGAFVRRRFRGRSAR